MLVGFGCIEFESMSLRDNLRADTVTSLHLHKPVEIDPDGTVGGVVALMQETAASCVIITDQDRPVGIVTERDILTKVLPQGLSPGTPLAKIMTSAPQVVEEDCSVAEVIRRMHQGGFRNMPVVDKDGRLTGVVSVRRIVQYLVEHFPSAVFNLPPDHVLKHVAREGA